MEDAEVAAHMACIEALKQSLCAEFHSPRVSWDNLANIAGHGDAQICELMRRKLRTMEAWQLFQGPMVPVNRLRGKSQPLLHKTLASLLRSARIAQRYFDIAVRRLCDAGGLGPDDFKIAPVKSQARAREKGEEARDEAAVLDMNRATILCHDAGQFLRIFMHIGDIFGEVMRIKNKFNIRDGFRFEPPCVFVQMALRCDALESSLEPGSKWIVELQITTKDIYDIKQLGHVFYEVLRAGSIPRLCVLCNAYAGGPSFCLLGKTGNGKSTLGNVLLGRDEFKTCHLASACTLTPITEVSDTEAKIIVTDTPGLGDRSGADQNHVDAVSNHLRVIKRVDLFLLVLNGQDPRLDEQQYNILQLYSAMIPNFASHTALVFTRWTRDLERRNQRIQCTRETVKVEINNILRTQVGMLDASQTLPAFFIESCPFDDDADEQKAMQECKTALINLASSKVPFCNNVNTVRTRVTEMKQQLDDIRRAAEENREREEVQRQAALTAQREREAQQQADERERIAEIGEIRIHLLAEQERAAASAAQLESAIAAAAREREVVARERTEGATRQQALQRTLEALSEERKAMVERERVLAEQNRVLEVRERAAKALLDKREREDAEKRRRERIVSQVVALHRETHFYAFAGPESSSSYAWLKKAGIESVGLLRFYQPTCVQYVTKPLCQLPQDHIFKQLASSSLEAQHFYEAVYDDRLRAGKLAEWLQELKIPASFLDLGNSSA